MRSCIRDRSRRFTPLMLADFMNFASGALKRLPPHQSGYFSQAVWGDG